MPSHLLSNRHIHISLRRETHFPSHSETTFSAMKNSIIFLFEVLVVQSCMIWLAMCTSNNFTDQSALLAFESGLNLKGDLANKWTVTTNFCGWVGVSCNAQKERVTALNLNNMGLGGTISPHIGNLSFLRILDLGNNNFHGQIPHELGRLRRVKDLKLYENDLEGEVPSSLYHCENLEQLFLGANNLKGIVPKELGYLPKLRSLQLYSNHFTLSSLSFVANISTLQSLGLGSLGITGTFPPFIFNISSLLQLMIPYSGISDTIPTNFCHYFPKLQLLELSSNRLSGPFPLALNQCRELTSLSMEDNNFHGVLPSEISTLSNLETLLLESNNFSGIIPPSIGNISGLANFWIGENNIQGTIPKELGRLSNLANLVLQYNSITGEIPQEVLNISSLQAFSIVFNDVYGMVPIYRESQLPNLQIIYLGGNRLNGSIPEYLSNSSKLRDMDFGSNFFTGPIPTYIGDFENLQILQLGHNLLTAESGSVELSFMNSLTRCKFLKRLVLDSNPLDGVLPNSIGNLSNTLETFSMKRCQIKGSIPKEIGFLKDLKYLDLSNNNLRDHIPSTIGGLENLQRLFLSNNNIEGNIPNTICRLSYLGELLLQNNKLNGSIIDCIEGLSRLQKLQLDSNNLTSSVPKSLFNLQNLLFLNLSFNSLSGSLPSNMRISNVIETLDFSSNKLSGEIPSIIGQFKGLSSLNLSRNSFQGPIPQSFGDLMSLDFLDLSHNNLSGAIPKILQSLLHLKFLNISFNKLSGEIPKGGSFLNFTAQSFIGNDNLCGEAYLDVPPCKIGKSRKSSRTKKILLACIIPVVVAAAVTILFFFLYSIRKYKKDNRTTSNSFTTSPTFERLERRMISYQELRHATDDFLESNLLGHGSFGLVYKGTLSDGKFVAIKVMNLQREGAVKSFDAECKVFRSVRHRNLVKVITACSNQELRALVLEYMPNGSLDKWLHVKGYKLTLYQRLSILVDVAAALDYLHHGQPEPIVHCDLKPSNVLLDEDMSAHVSDFGIAKVLAANTDETQTMTLGTIGYIAPEYGSEGKVTTKGDIYSFGIILMEVFTGKRPTDDMFVGGQSLRQWVFESLPKDIMQVMDANLIARETKDSNVMEKTNCLSSFMELAMECSEESPVKRIDIKEVIVRINKIKSELSPKAAL